MTNDQSQPRAASQSSASPDHSKPPTIDYWHVWTDQAGVSHQSRRQIQDFKLKSIAPPASPQWMGQVKQEGATVVFLQSPLTIDWRVAQIEVALVGFAYKFT